MMNAPMMEMQQEPQQQPRQRQTMRQATTMSEMQRLEGKIDDLRGEVQSVRLLVASMMPRAEVEAADSKRVSLETYTSDQREVRERLTRLEASPTRLLAWASGGIGCLGVLVSIVSVSVFILEFILTHYKP